MSHVFIQWGPNTNDIVIVCIYVPIFVCHLLCEARARSVLDASSWRQRRGVLGLRLPVACIAVIAVGTIVTAAWHAYISYVAYATGSWTRLPKMIWFHIIGVPAVGWLSWHWVREFIADSE